MQLLFQRKIPRAVSGFQELQRHPRSEKPEVQGGGRNRGSPLSVFSERRVRSDPQHQCRGLSRTQARSAPRGCLLKAPKRRVGKSNRRVLSSPTRQRVGKQRPRERGSIQPWHDPEGGSSGSVLMFECVLAGIKPTWRRQKACKPQRPDGGDEVSKAAGDERAFQAQSATPVLPPPPPPTHQSQPLPPRSGLPPPTFPK